MPDDRTSPSAGWREVCDEMGVDRSWEGDPPDADCPAVRAERRLAEHPSEERRPEEHPPEPAIREVGAGAD